MNANSDYWTVQGIIAGAELSVKEPYFPGDPSVEIRYTRHEPLSRGARDTLTFAMGFRCDLRRPIPHGKLVMCATHLRSFIVAYNDYETRYCEARDFDTRFGWWRDAIIRYDFHYSNPATYTNPTIS